MWRNFLATFLLQFLRYASSRSREKRSAEPITLNVPAKETSLKAVKTETPSYPLDGGAEMVLWENIPYRWNEIPPNIVFSRRIGRAVEKFQISFWGITAISEGLKKGDRSLCEVFGLDPEEFASTLRNAGVPHNPSADVTMTSSEQQDNSPAVHGSYS